MTQSIRLLYWVMSCLLLATSACQSRQDDSPKVTVAQATIAPVTKLEPPQSIPITKLENSQPSQTTITSVEQTLSDLKAQKTGEGILINLPENILFDFDKSELRPSAKPTLVKVNQLLNHYSNAPVTISGHTDSKGSDAYNQSLSEKRAEAVKDYLVKNFNVQSNRLEAKGFGETQPVAPNAKLNDLDNPEGRQKNRRVEVLIQA